MISSDDFSTASFTDLNTSFIGKRIIYYPSVASTMDVARLEAQKGVAEGTVIIAGEQTGGRGRMKRTWLSPEGNIALSVILYPDVSYLPYLVMLTSLAVVHTIEAITGLKPQIKWPNDILINGKKVCGILIENGMNRGGAYAIVGVGINVGLSPSDFAEISAIATSLSGELGKEVLSTDLVRHLLVEMERMYLKLPEGESVYEEWLDRLITLGKRVHVASRNNVLEGIAESVDRSGSLILRLADGSSTRIVAGDVSLSDN